MTIPDFRDQKVRERFRNDDGTMKRPFDPAGMFPDGHDPAKTGIFNSLMLLIRHVPRPKRFAVP